MLGTTSWGQATCLGWASFPCNGSAMDQGGSESAMGLLVTGILVLGGIAVFISWGLSNAYLPN